MKAILIREGDYFLSLRNRIGKAREHKADLFISIHADAFKDQLRSPFRLTIWLPHYLPLC